MGTVCAGDKKKLLRELSLTTWQSHQNRYRWWDINDLDFIYVTATRYRLNWEELLQEYRHPIRNRHSA